LKEMETKDFGYLDNPANGYGIIRARTLVGNLRIWDIPRSERALETIINEIGQSPIPGLYLLLDEKKNKKSYIGQTENIEARLSSHIFNPEDKIKNWDRVIIINDARNAKQSDFNDENIRLSLENFLVNLLKINRYTVVTTSTRSPSLSSTQQTLFNNFKDEIIVLLTRKSKITKILSEKKDNEVYSDEVKKILERKKFKISSWGKIEAIINDQKTFIRPGSSKNKGWQVTFRGNKPDSLKTRLEKGEGLLLVPRGPILLIPLTNIREFVLKTDPLSFTRDTIDIFLNFENDEVSIVYKSSKLLVSKSTIINKIQT